MIDSVNFIYCISKKFKRISLKFKEDEGFVINVPSKAHIPLAEKFISQNSDWIKKVLRKNEARLAKLGRYKFDFKPGDKVILFDEPVYELVWIESVQNKYVIDEDSDRLIVYCQVESKIKDLLIKFYRDKAREIFEERAAYFASLLEVSFGKIFIKDQSSRWGSCSSKGNLNFNFRLLLAPERVLDYLVVHEICHLKEMNHSSRFWKLVENLMPDYKLQDRWLKENGFLLKYFLR